jgi:predicted nucleic acid-binding protein
MNVLVDTSVWIRFLSKQMSISGPLDALLAQDQVFGHELVFGELWTANSALREAAEQLNVCYSPDER